LTDTEIFLTGSKVFLRPLQLDDLNGGYPTWFNNPDVCRFNSHHAMPYLREQALEYIHTARTSNENLVLAIVSRELGRHVGNVSLAGIRGIDRCAEYAIVLGDQDVLGTGIAFEASYLIVKHGFDALGLARIECGTSHDNEPMRRLALRLAMKEEGCRRQSMWKNGRFVDVIQYGVLASEFQQVAQPKAPT
jgi:[ribosomal protein S5]-alanine N-acetyltransferase